MKINRKKESDGERIRPLRRIAVGKSRRIRTGSTPPPNAGNDPLPLDRTFRLHRTASNAGSGPPATAIAARRDPERRLRRRMQDAARPAGSAGILPYKFRSAVQNRQTAYPRPGRSSSGKAPPLRLGTRRRTGRKRTVRLFLGTPDAAGGVRNRQNVEADRTNRPNPPRQSHGRHRGRTPCYFTPYCLLTPRFDSRMNFTRRSRSGDCKTLRS